MKRSGPAKSLFAKPMASPIPGTVDEQLHRAFGKKTGPAFWKTPAQLFESNLSAVEKTAQQAEVAPAMKRGKEYAESLRTQAELLRQHVEAGDSMRAAVVGMALGQTHTQVRSDAFFAAPVAARQKQDKALDDNRPAAKITPAAHAIARQKAPTNQAQRARLLKVSRQALVKRESKMLKK